MTNLPQSSIPPFTIAQKLAAADNRTNPQLAAQLRQQPRLAELLWFVQWQSFQPGGLDKFALELIEQFTPRFGPPILHADIASLTLEQRVEIWEAIPDETKRRLIPIAAWERKWEHQRDADNASNFMAMARTYGKYPNPEGAMEKALFQEAQLKITQRQFRDAYLDASKEHLAARLRTLCIGRSEEIEAAAWYCPQLTDVLIEAMDLHAGRIELQHAQTEVFKLAFDRFNYAWEEKVLVKIEGDTRTGKSEAVRAWSNMHPGKCRLVATPIGNTLRDLICAVAESLGVAFTPHTPTPELKDQVQFIIRHSGLFFIFDEAHFLLPASYSANVHPVRLDWLRTEIVDQKLPVALVCTPQAFRHAVQRFEKRTGYNFGQFLGRIMLNVALPNELSEADFMAVVAIHGADIPEEHHAFIAARAMRAEGYLKAVEAICSYARYHARHEHHPIVQRADVEHAAAQVSPATTAQAPARSAPPAPCGRRTSPRPIRDTTPAAPAVTAPARITQPAPALEMPARATTPALQPM